MGLYPLYKPIITPCPEPTHALELLWQTDAYDMRRGEAPPPDLDAIAWQIANDQNSNLITCYYDAAQRRFYINFDPHIGNAHHPAYRVGGAWVSIEESEFPTIDHVVGHFFGNPGIIVVEPLFWNPMPMPFYEARGMTPIKDLREEMRFIVRVG